ncbi:hypothetical protein SAMN05421663_105111 [Terribacillus halophilus]|uniref:Uncharacterized protein n=1 Tax=Terribacillus halophilus TaxID=361279 RepID=A0A1G6QKT3_9BACI|nr:hypothetical protein SAMN05421663_105111 [Terribacillus halophilus]
MSKRGCFQEEVVFFRKKYYALAEAVLLMINL